MFGPTNIYKKEIIRNIYFDNGSTRSNKAFRLVVVEQHLLLAKINHVICFCQ